MILRFLILFLGVYKKVEAANNEFKGIQRKEIKIANLLSIQDDLASFVNTTAKKLNLTVDSKIDSTIRPDDSKIKSGFNDSNIIPDDKTRQTRDIAESNLDTNLDTKPVTDLDTDLHTADYVDTPWNRLMGKATGIQRLETEVSGLLNALSNSEYLSCIDKDYEENLPLNQTITSEKYLLDIVHHKKSGNQYIRKTFKDPLMFAKDISNRYKFSRNQQIHFMASVFCVSSKDYKGDIYYLMEYKDYYNIDNIRAMDPTLFMASLLVTLETLVQKQWMMLDMSPRSIFLTTNNTVMIHDFIHLIPLKTTVTRRIKTMGNTSPAVGSVSQCSSDKSYDISISDVIYPYGLTVLEVMNDYYNKKRASVFLSSENKPFYATCQRQRLVYYFQILLGFPDDLLDFVHDITGFTLNSFEALRKLQVFKQVNWVEVRKMIHPDSVEKKPWINPNGFIGSLSRMDPLSITVALLIFLFFVLTFAYCTFTCLFSGLTRTSKRRRGLKTLIA
jgi:hypothetical protein